MGRLFGLRVRHERLESGSMSEMAIFHQLTAASRNPRRGGVGHNPFAARFSHVNEFSFTAQSTQVFGVEERLGQVAIERDTRKR
jgi:hypothetical protein